MKPGARFALTALLVPAWGWSMAPSTVRAPLAPAVAASTTPNAATASQVKQLHRQTRRQQQQVERLRDQVQALERDNQAAQDRLQAKDAAIADLRQRLQAIEEHPGEPEDKR